MALAHLIKPAAPDAASFAVRLGSGSGAANNWTQAEEGKLVKLAGESQYDLAAAGNEIEAVVTSVELATQQAWTVGGVLDAQGTRMRVTFDGLQATPGTGTIAVGDYVVAGTITAKGTALTAPPKVCKATAAGNTLNYKWRVVSLGTAGTGAVGTTGVIARV